MTQRKFYIIHKKGSIENLKLESEELEDPKENEITVEVKSIGLNFADIFAIQGLYSATPRGSFVPGLEFSGFVYKKGKKVKNWKVGERILGVTKFGAYATHLNVNSRYVQKLPKNWSFEEGAGFSAQALTAYYALVVLGDIQKKSTVLIHSAAGGVGIFANRIAKKFHCYTIGVVGGEAKIPILKKEGFDDWMIRSKNFKEDLNQKLKNRDLNLVLECIGGKIFQDSLDALSPMGRLITYGSANFMTHGNRLNYFQILKSYFQIPRLNSLNLVSANKSVMGFNLIWLWDKHDLMSKYVEDLLKLKLSPPLVSKTFPFTEMKKALQHFQSGKSIGKIIANVP